MNKKTHQAKQANLSADAAYKQLAVTYYHFFATKYYC